MQLLFLTLILGLTNSLCKASGLSGPFLLWGHKKVESVQPYSLVEGDEEDFANLYKDAKAIVIFVRNNTITRLDSSRYPKLHKVIQTQAWSYLPQRSLVIEPYKYNSNVEVVNLGNVEITEDDEIVDGFNDAITIYGEGSVLGILANGVDETNAHFISKRQAEKKEEETTPPTPPSQTATTDSFIYMADKNLAVLMVKNAPTLNLSKESFTLIKRPDTETSVTFDDQSQKGYGRFTIIFLVGKQDEKLFLRFNFTISRGSWTMKDVEVQNTQNKTILTLTGHPYSFPSAPVKFSYRCGPYSLIFRNGEDSLNITDFQVQPWLNGKTKFGDVYDCVGFVTAPILAGVLVTLFLCGILSVGLMAIYDIKTPNKFENSRSKQLTFTVQE